MGFGISLPLINAQTNETNEDDQTSASNQKTALSVAQARGVLLATLRAHTITIDELTPLQIKSRLTGYGAASKEQIQTVVTARLHLDKPPQPDDTADAIAAALCIADNNPNELK